MITQKEVEHIAHLARIELSDAEKQKFENELSAILDFIGKLNEVDTSSTMPVTGGTTLENVMRNDEEFEPLGNPQNLIDSAPNTKEKFITVKKIL